MSAVMTAELPSPRAHHLKPKPYQPLSTIGSIWRSSVWNLREKAVLTLFVTLASNETLTLNAPGNLVRYGQKALARLARLSKSGLHRALRVLSDPTLAGVIETIHAKLED